MTCDAIDLTLGPAAPVVLQLNVSPIELVAAPSPMVLEVQPSPIELVVTPQPVILEITGVGAQGPIGPAGNGGKAFMFNQVSPSLSWVVFHDLGTKPQITVVIDGAQQFCRVNYPNDQSALLEFNSPVAGQAYCVG